MAASNTVRVSASPTQVRVWAVEQGLIKAGQHGRLGAGVIKAYNKSHAVKHTEAGFVQTVKVTAKPDKGRTVTRTVNVAQVREAAKAAGFAVGARGRLPQSILSAYVLGTLNG